MNSLIIILSSLVFLSTFHSVLCLSNKWTVYVVLGQGFQKQSGDITGLTLVGPLTTFFEKTHVFESHADNKVLKPQTTVHEGFIWFDLPDNDDSEDPVIEAEKLELQWTNHVNLIKHPIKIDSVVFIKTAHKINSKTAGYSYTDMVYKGNHRAFCTDKLVPPNNKVFLKDCTQEKMGLIREKAMEIQQQKLASVTEKSREEEMEFNSKVSKLNEEITALKYENNKLNGKKKILESREQKIRSELEEKILKKKNKKNKEKK